MGRYFNDDLTEDQNDEPDAYLEHYGIPKEKWDATVRARYEQLHHKTKDAYRSISDGAKKFGSKASKQINKTTKPVKDYFTKKKHRVSYALPTEGEGKNRRTVGIKTYKVKHYNTDFQNDVLNAKDDVRRKFNKETSYEKQANKAYKKDRHKNEAPWEKHGTFKYNPKASKEYNETLEYNTTGKTSNKPKISHETPKSASKEYWEERAYNEGKYVPKKTTKAVKPKNPSKQYREEVEYNSRKNKYPKKKR